MTVISLSVESQTGEEQQEPNGELHMQKAQKASGQRSSVPVSELWFPLLTAGRTGDAGVQNETHQV